MPEIFTKTAPPKVDPKKPETHPGYSAAVKKGEQNLPKLKFENESQKKDYMKAVAANPNNVPGLPAFYPPMTLGTFSGFSGIDVVKKDMLPCGKKWSHATYGEGGVATYRCGKGCTCEGYRKEDLRTE